LGERLLIRGVPGPGFAAEPGAPVLACIRKESVRIEGSPVAGSQPGRIEAASFLGVAEEYIVDVGGVAIRATRPAAGFAGGDTVHVTMAAEDFIVLR
jgi:hypothetical protein